MPDPKREVIANIPRLHQCIDRHRAKRLGVPRRRVRQLERLIDSFIEGDTRRRHAARRGKVKTKRRR
ncbi:MAG TPA: hypothetical protein VIE36_00640 [Methylomirabilota bacterium]|jgi:hypothetical protein